MTGIITIASILWLEMLRKKDIYVLLILAAVLLSALASLNIFHLGGAVGYVKDIGLLLTWLFSWILAVNISARAIPTEEKKGTIFQILSKPVSRMEFIAGKWLGTWLVASASTMVFYALTTAIVMLHGGNFDFSALLQGLMLHCAALGIIAATGILISTRMTQNAAITLTFVVTCGAFFIVPSIPEMAFTRQGASEVTLLVAYYIMPHLEFFDMRKRLVHDFGPADWNIFCMAMLYAAVITTLLLFLAWSAYRKKNFSREILLQ